MKTAIVAIATLIYLGYCIAKFINPELPFAVIVWGGLILIFAWWIHDVIQEREGVGRFADRTR